MKQSKSSKGATSLGFIVFLISAILSLISINDPTVAFGYLGLGMSAMAIFWIMGIQTDLYENEKDEKKND